MKKVVWDYLAETFANPGSSDLGERQLPTKSVTLTQFLKSGDIKEAEERETAAESILKRPEAKPTE